MSEGCQMRAVQLLQALLCLIHISHLPKAQHNHSRLRVTTLSWPKAKLSPFAQLPSHHQYLSIHSILDICYEERLRRRVAYRGVFLSDSEPSLN